MRLYAVTNSTYMSPIQCGIQTAHLVAELFARWGDMPAEPPLSKPQTYGRVLSDWANLHKTIYVLGVNGTAELRRALGLFVAASGDPRKSPLRGIPVGSFSEDKDSLDGALTVVGGVIPTEVCEIIDRYREKEHPANLQNVPTWHELPLYLAGLRRA